jgi:N-acetylneuraminate synthase
MSVKDSKKRYHYRNIGEAMINTIAEIGLNHNGDIDIAKQLISIAKSAGVDFVKFQKRTPDVCVPEHQKNVMRETHGAI